MAAVTEREEKTIAVIREIFQSLGDFDKGYLLGFGQGAQAMRDKAAERKKNDDTDREETTEISNEDVC